MTDTKPEGPYTSQQFKEMEMISIERNGEVSSYGWLFCREDGRLVAELANEAYAEGYKAGRESRKGLRKALEIVDNALVKRHSGNDFISEALAEDEKNGGGRLGHVSCKCSLSKALTGDGCDICNPTGE